MSLLDLVVLQGRFLSRWSSASREVSKEGELARLARRDISHHHDDKTGDVQKMILGLDMLRCVKNRQAARGDYSRSSLSSRAAGRRRRWRGRLDLSSRRFYSVLLSTINLPVACPLATPASSIDWLARGTSEA